MCIKPPAAYTKVPNAHPMMRITAIIYNNDLMINYLMVNDVLPIANGVPLVKHSVEECFYCL